MAVHQFGLSWPEGKNSDDDVWCTLAVVHMLCFMQMTDSFRLKKTVVFRSTKVPTFKMSISHFHNWALIRDCIYRPGEEQLVYSAVIRASYTDVCGKPDILDIQVLSPNNSHTNVNLGGVGNRQHSLSGNSTTIPVTTTFSTLTILLDFHHFHLHNHPPPL